MEIRIERLLRQMTLEEKAGQLSLVNPFGPNLAQMDSMISKGLVGATAPSFNGVEETNAWQRAAVEKSRLHIPLIIALDVIHGQRTIFPVPLALAGSFDMQLIGDATRVAASEAKLESVNFAFAPMLDVSRDARWGRIVESPGEDTFLASVIAKTYVSAFQGSSLSDPNSVGTSAKHFAAYGAAEGGRDYNTVDMSERTLRSVYLPPFETAVKAGSASVMAAFHSLNGVPVTANRHMLTDILRREWGFTGFTISDAGSIAELKNHGLALNDEIAMQKALRAGLDMDLGGESSRLIPSLVRSGEIPVTVLDEAVRRVLRVKFELGLFNHPYGSERALVLPLPERRALARKAVHESLVLLKNAPHGSSNPVLPLSQAAKTVALIGQLADAPDQMMGPWAVVGSSKDVITLKTALASRLAERGGTLLYAKGCEILKEAERMAPSPSIGEFIGKPEPTIPNSERIKGQDGFAEALQAARQSDVVIMALGEDRTMSGEAGSRTRLDLPGEQQALLEAVAATGKPVVLLLFSGRPLAITWAAEHVPAIVEAWYPGDEAGPGIVDVLYGDVNPSGHLAASFPRSIGQEPLYYNHLTTGRPASHLDLTHPPLQQSERWFSRYIDQQNSPLFPFGWGLSYTTFTFSTPTVSKPLISMSATKSKSLALTTVKVDVTNSGAVEGDAVVQLYLGVRGASVAMPERELKGFKRVHLRPGETQTIEFPLRHAELSYLSQSSKRIIEPVDYHVWIGDSSLADKSVGFKVR